MTSCDCVLRERKSDSRFTGYIGRVLKNLLNDILIYLFTEHVIGTSLQYNLYFV